MNDNYGDIKHLTRPQYDDLRPMSMSDMAAQFSPFLTIRISKQLILKTGCLLFSLHDCLVMKIE